MSLDIGGTSADVALILDGQPQYATGEYIGEFQIHIPSVSVTSIGDGGGSIAWVDEFGVLKVGPESAGSNPGPVCYGRGGTRFATITDAFAVMGVIGNASLGYNSVKVDHDAACRAVDALAQRLGSDLYKTAEAIVNVSVSGMYAGVEPDRVAFRDRPAHVFAAAVRRRGSDARMLLRAGARQQEQVVVPTTPGVLSALGGLIADTNEHFVKTTYYDLDAAARSTRCATMRARSKRPHAPGWLRV